MSVLSDEKLREVYDSKGCHDAGLRAVAEAAIAADRAARAEPVAGDVLPPVGSRVWIRHGRDDAAHACIVTGYYAWRDLVGEQRLHRVFVRLVYEGTSTKQARMLCDCYATEADALAAAPAPSQEPTAPASDQIAAAVKAERERIYALIDTNPEHIWRDAGFMQWRAKRSQENHD